MRRPTRLPGLVAPFLAILGLLVLVGFFVAASGAAGRGYDFRAYWDAGARLAGGESLYDPATLAGPFRPGPFGLYLYPPPLAVVLLPLQAMGLPIALQLWTALHIVLLVVACAVMPVPRSIQLAVFGTTALSYPALIDLNLGNVSIVVLALAAAGWRWLDRPPGSIAIAAAIALRSPMAIVLGWQLLRRRWRAVAWTVGGGLAMIAVTLPVVGVQAYLDYLKVLANLREITGVPKNVDLASTALSAGASPEVADLVLLAGYGVAIGAILLTLRRDPEIGYVTAVTATLLLSPLLWDHYLVLLALPAALLAARGRWLAAALPLLAWLPPAALPLVAVAGTLLPLIAPRTERAKGVSPG